jgi:hypothetical protein
VKHDYKILDEEFNEMLLTSPLSYKQAMRDASDDQIITHLNSIGEIVESIKSTLELKRVDITFDEHYHAINNDYEDQCNVDYDNDIVHELNFDHS